MVLSWWELPEEEQPPSTIWGLNEQIDEWFQAVKARREEKFGTSSDGVEMVKDADMTGNEYVKQIRDQQMARASNGEASSDQS